MGCLICKCMRCADSDSALEANNTSNTTRDEDSDALPAASAAASHGQLFATSKHLVKEQHVGTLEKPGIGNEQPQPKIHLGTNLGVSAAKPTGRCMSDDSSAFDDSESDLASVSSESLSFDCDDGSETGVARPSTFRPVCGSNKPLASSDINSWDLDSMDSLTSVKNETPVNKILCSTPCKHLAVANGCAKVEELTAEVHRPLTRCRKRKQTEALTGKVTDDSELNSGMSTIVGLNSGQQQDDQDHTELTKIRTHDMCIGSSTNFGEKSSLASASYTTEQERLEQEVFKGFGESMNNEQVKYKIMSRPLIRHDSMLQSEEERKEKEASAKPIDGFVPAKQSANKRLRFARNDLQPATAADTETLHERKKTKGVDRTRENLRAVAGYVEVRSGGKRISGAQHLSTRHGEGRRRAGPTSGEASECNGGKSAVAVISSRDQGETKLQVGSSSRIHDNGSSISFGQKHSIAPVSCTEKQERLEKGVFRNFDESVKNEAHYYKPAMTSEPLINQETKSSAKPLHEMARVEQLENERRQFARNGYQAASTAILHDVGKTKGADETTQNLYADDGCVEVRSGGKWTGNVVRLLSRRGKRRRADPAGEGVVHDYSEWGREVLEVSDVDEERVGLRGQTDLRNTNERHKIGSSVSFGNSLSSISRTTGFLIPAPFVTERERPHNSVRKYRRHSNFPSLDMLGDQRSLSMSKQPREMQRKKSKARRQRNVVVALRDRKLLNLVHYRRVFTNILISR